MGKNILILSASPRKNGNSAKLAEEFERGAREAGHRTEFIYLADLDIRFCRGCLTCLNTQRCVIRDDAEQVCQKMREADVVAFATPIYYYQMSGQLKTMLDRCNPLYTSDYAFRDIYVLTTAAEDGLRIPERTASGVEGWIECFDRARLAGVVFAGGVTKPGDICGHPSLQRAYRLGKNA